MVAPVLQHHDPHLDSLFQELDSLLQAEEWEAADEITLMIMLVASGQQQRWLDRGAIAYFPCPVLHQLDQRWVRYSMGHFGFTPQWELYNSREIGRSALAFSQAVEWTNTRLRPLAFFKFYDFLNFSLDAPRGHLPALWFWRLPWWLSWRMGGFGTGRGAAFGDASLFDALMLRLERCQALPDPKPETRI
jgi:hypothetical protein